MMRSCIAFLSLAVGVQSFASNHIELGLKPNPEDYGQCPVSLFVVNPDAEKRLSQGRLAKKFFLWLW